MTLSRRSGQISESLTLALNTKALELAQLGRQVYNLTAGQLPLKPPQELMKLIKSECDNLESYQYSPVLGLPSLRKALITAFETSRRLTLPDFDCVVSNGAKHSLSNAIATLIDPGDEVVLLRPYWLSYPEIVTCFGGVPKFVDSNVKNLFTPDIDDLKKAFTQKTKAVIINSPNNPAGIHYPHDWMKDFGRLLLEEYPQIWAISDEIYYDLSYTESRPSYFYQDFPELLERTLIINGISKALASTGLRIGYTLAAKSVAKALGKIQGHTASNANSLIQRALASFDFLSTSDYLKPINTQLRENALTLYKTLQGLRSHHHVYQPTSAFYYLLHFDGRDQQDRSLEWAEKLLDKYAVACVPGGAFGMRNTARISLVGKRQNFQEACKLIASFIEEEDR